MSQGMKEPAWLQQDHFPWEPTHSPGADRSWRITRGKKAFQEIMATYTPKFLADSGFSCLAMQLIVFVQKKNTPLDFQHQ